MGLKIYDRAGGLRIEVQPSDSSSQTAELQGDDVLSMSFSHHGYVGLEVDDYVDFEGVRYRMTERYRPKQKSAMEWEYSIKLYGPESLLRDVLVIKNFEGEHEAEFTLTAPPAEHVALVVSALNGDNGSEWKRGTVTGSENITIDYFGKYCDEALREIAEKAGTEYWTDGTTVNVCRCEHGEPLTLGLADGLTRIEPATAGNVKFYTRLFPMGSTRNIDAESYGHRRLQLPDGAKYVEINADRYRRKDHYEEAAFADIYPRYTGTVSSVRSETRKGADGEDFTVYYFKDDALPFDPDDYLMAGKVMRISFQEGSDLGGLGDEDNGTYYFETNWHADSGEFELITIWPYKDSATQLPGGVLVPKVGDKYIPWNMRMPQEYYTLAEAEFAAAVQKYNADHDVDLTVFKAQTDHVWVEDNAAELFVGRRIRLVSDRYFPETGYRDSRITKISRKINLPTQMEVEIGDALGRSSKTKITDDIRDARDYARSIGNSVSLPDIIRTSDTTRPTDNNLMSALRIIKDFLCKYKDDRTAHKLASDKAFEVGEFLAGISGGFFGIDQNGDSYLEVARLYARVRAVFEELMVIKTGVLAGKQYITPGGGIVCTKVEEVTNASGTLTGWRCYFLSEQDGEKTECKFIVNDQAISALFNAATGTANKVSNHRYWRLVTAVDNDAYTDDSGNHYGYIELSATDCEAGSDTPQTGDEICQFGYRGTDEPRRQTAMVFSTVDADAPSIKLFRGINSYTLEGKAVVQFGVDAQTGKVFFRLGASNATHFLDYTEAGGLQVAGKISTLSTLDDTNTTLGTAINSKVEDTDVLWRLHTSQTDAPALPVLGVDGTITDFKGWQTDAPAVVSGQFVWTTTYVRYGNGTAKFDGTACVTGRDGKDGVTMTSEKVEYAIGTSGTVAPTSGWSTTIPAIPKGQYQWTRVTTTYSDGTPTVSYSVAYIPKDGEDGAAGSNYTPNMLVGSRDWSGATPKGATNAGTISADKYNGFSVLEATGWWFGRYWIIDVEAGKDYTISCIALGAPDNFNLMLNPGWGSSMFTSTFTQTKSEKRFSTSQWGVAVRQIHCTKSGTLLVDFETADKSLLVKWCAPKVEEGLNDAPVWSPAPSEQLGVTIASESVTYAKNTTGIQPPDASFTATAIGQLGTISGGDYIWSKTEVTYTDGTVLKSYAVSRIGSDGETQVAGLHIAYATGITGSLPHPTAVTGFSTTMVAGVTYKYIGIRKDNSTADSTNFADYDWAEFRGSDGQNGASYTNNMLVGTKDWSGWTTDNVFSKDGTYEGLDVMHGVSRASGFYSLAIASAITLEANTVYTLSMWAKGTGRFFSYVWPSVTARIINIDGVDSTSIAGDTKAEHTLSTEWKRYFVVFRTLSGSTLINKNVIAARLHAGDGEVWVAGVKIEKGDNRTPTWSPHPSEMVATPAKVVIVNAPQLVFTYENNFATIVGAQQIVLQSTLQGTTGRQWSYRPGSASGFTDYPNATGETFTVPHNHSTYFPNGAKSCTFRCTSGDVYDEVTIYKVSSGAQGVQGIPGADGRGVVGTTITYQLGTSGTTAPTGTWSTNVPTLTKGKYLWTRSVTTYTTGDPTTLYSVSYIAKDGSNGSDGLPGKDGVGIVSTTVTYTKSTGNTTAPTSGWQPTIPSVPAGQYLWTKTVWKYTDGSEETGYSVAKQGDTGADGANYTENLVLKSDEEVRTTNYQVKRFYTSENLVVGETYTWTFWGTPGAGRYLRVYATSWLSASMINVPKKAEGVYSVTAVWNADLSHPNTIANAFDLLAAPNTATTESVITKVKVEKGSNPNPVWTPAPADGDGITVILTNESHVFEGDTEKAKAGSTECGVIAYKGATQVAATIGPITGDPSGMTATIANNGTTSAKFTVAVTSAMAAKQGVLTIPVTVDGKSFTKKFSWSVSLEGQPGADYSENLLADAEFRGMAATEKVARWYKYSNVSVDNTHMMEGRNSMKSAQSGLTAAGWRGISQNYSKDVKSGDVFTCSIWVYCEDTSVFDSTNTMRMEMIGSNSSGNRTCTFPVSIIPSENNKWQQFHVSGTMPAGTIQVQLYAWVRQNGTAWFSSPKLERGSNPSPVWTPNPTDRIPVLTEEYYRSSSDTEQTGGSWSATKQPWAANSYYWTRIKKLYGDGTIEYTTPICATGTPGKDALRLDLTNEMAGVACNASGTPVSGALASVTSTAEVYKGGAKDSGWKFKKSDSGCSSNINESSGAITLNSISSDTATVTVTATKDGYDDLTATMSIHKVKPGADGQPATVYQVEPSTNVIKRDMAGTPHPADLVVTKYRTTGAAARQTTTELYLHAIQKDANDNTVSSVVNTAATTTITIVPDAVKVVLELRPSNQTGSNIPVFDRETVPVITDVADMEVATRNLLLGSGDWNLPDGAFSSNPLQGDWWWDDLSMSGSSGNLKMTCNATSGNRAAYERLSIRKAAKYTTMTLRVKGTVSGRTSGHIYFQLVCNWSTWQTVGQVAANGEFDLIKTFDLSDEWNGDTILAYGFSNANSGISLELEHAGLYIGNVIPTQWTAAPEDSNYLLKAIQRARQDSTEIDGGVILAALLRLGITGSDGVRKIMAGLNGNGESRDALAAFFGGDLIDAALEPNNENRARAAIRHDGTAYFCDNVVRMLENSIELGDSIKFDTAGMKLIGPDKRVRMSITNEMLSDTDVASAASYVTSWNGSFSAQSIRIGSRSQVTRPNGMIQQGATGITHGATWTYSLGSRTANSVLNGTVSLSLGINMNNIPESEPWIGGGLKVEIFYTANSKEYVVFSGSSSFYTDPTTGKGTVQINATLPVSTTYTLRVIATESTGIIAVGTARSITPTASGQVIRGASDMIKHASNGIVAILGNMRFLMRENYFGVQVSARFGAQLTPNGIFLKLGSTSWQLLTKASDGTLKLT